MQTFLPYDDFEKCARCLDRKRLWKQALEGYQLVRTVKGITSGWKNHPAAVMWKNYPDALILYTEIMLKECNQYLDVSQYKTGNLVFPWWFENKEIMNLIVVTHRSNLIRKMPDYYGAFNWNVPNDLPYYWPGANP